MLSFLKSKSNDTKESKIMKRFFLIENLFLDVEDYNVGTLHPIEDTYDTGVVITKSSIENKITMNFWSEIKMK